MRNTIPQVVVTLLALMERVYNGAVQLGATIGLLQNTGPNIRLDVDPMIEANDNYEQGKVLLADKRKVVDSLFQAGYEYVRLCRDILRPKFGTRYSQAWNVAGFIGSLQLPRTPDQLQGFLRALNALFTAHPDWEKDQLNITAARADSLLTDLIAAQNAVAAQLTAVTGLINIRDQKAARLRKRLRCVLSELDLLLEPLDPRWLTFGLNMPGAAETPKAPTAVHVSLNGLTGTVTWLPAARADHYRIWLKVVGVDQDARAIGSVADALFLAENLPANSTVEISVSAVNNGGESPLSKPVVVTTH